MRYDWIKMIRAAVTDTWDFSVSTDYLTASGVQITSVAELAVKNYASDGNTGALYHFDETLGAGAVANDSSGSGNNAAVVGGTFAAGSLNNSLSLNAVNGVAVAPDAAATSLTGNLTLEAWTKFDAGFSATSGRERRGILDKGPYQLYYDNETGKVVFEMMPATANQWAQVAGPELLNTNGVSVNLEMNRSWDANSKNFIWRQVVVGADIYVALGSATSGTTVTGDAEVWRCANCATAPVWSKIGGDGVNGSWADGTYEDTSALASDGTNIYAGLGNTPGGEAEVWRYDGASWSKVGGDGVNSSWTTAGGYERVTTLIVNGTTVYAGLGLSAGDAEVWSCTGCDGGSPSWAKIGGDGTGAGGQSWATNTYEDVTALTIANGNILVVGLGLSGGDAEVWSCDLSATCTVTAGWTKRGGDGSGAGGQSWATTTYEEVRAIAASGTMIYVGLGNSAAGDAEVWRCDLGASCTVTAGWTKVGGDGVGSSFNTNYERVWSLLASGTTVYAGIGDSNGDAEVWRCTNCNGASPTWAQIGGDGNANPPQSWGNTTGAPFAYAASLSLVGTQLFVGASGAAGSTGAEMWRCDTAGTCSNTAGWTRVGGHYLNKSWGAFNLNSVESLTTTGGKLYAGTGYNTGAATANGNAQVWEFDGTSWTMIGGQGINGSWAYAHPSVASPTYKTVSSLAGYNGTLIAGIGSGTSGDAEVWSWNGTTWTKIGGDGTGTGGQSWVSGTFQRVDSLSVIGTRLYAGLFGGANGDAEIWSCDLAGSCTVTAGWTKVGGDGTGAGGQSWAAGTFRGVAALQPSGARLYVGLEGASAGDGEVWWCDTAASCAVTAGWTKFGGDGLNSGWANSTYEEVSALAFYRGALYAGLGASTGDAELWRHDGTNWGGTAVAGDGLNGSWNDAIYERVKAISSFNGDLIVALGDNAAGEGEVWKFDTAAWARIGGDGANSGWSNVVERVNALATYHGRFYAGTGLTANQDAMVWAYGGNVLLESATTSQDSTWHHIAATYNGSTARLFIDGVEEASRSVSASLLDTPHPLVIGALSGTQVAGRAEARLGASLDELRISNVARATFQTTPYSSAREAVTLATPVRTSGVFTWDGFSSSESPNGGAITYRISTDGGTSFQYWNGAAWDVSNALSEANDVATIDTHIATLPVTSGGLLWQAILLGNGNQRVTLNSVTLDATEDLTPPSNPNAVTALDQSGGSIVLADDTWYPHETPAFSWTGAADTQSGVDGYYVYFGPTASSDPETAGAFQTAATYVASGLSSGTTYYLRIKTRDRAQNRSGIVTLFTYKLDSAGPTNPSTVFVTPDGYSPTNDFTFVWSGVGITPAADASSGVDHYEYQVGVAVNAGSWITTTATSVNLPGAAYQAGRNNFWFRTLDTAGNASSTKLTEFLFAGTGPTEPQNLSVTPEANTDAEDPFVFSWDPPASFSGDADDLTYCWTVNILPSVDECTFTGAGVTTVAALGNERASGNTHTFYTVAKNGIGVGGAINYGVYTSKTFITNTTAPSAPLNMEIADVSVKNTASWKLALSWEAPSAGGGSVAEYEIYHSTDDTSYAKDSSTTGIAFVATGLTQETHYYKVRACDAVGKCGPFGSTVNLLPTGRFTEAAALTSEPKVTAITTKSATITWSTDRASDSRVQYGKSSRSYFSEEPSNSEQLTAHTIKLTNLSPGTKYYFKSRWTDEDGNIGISTESSFSTEPAPVVTDPQVKSAGLTTAVIRFTVENASKVKIYYGETTVFGGVKEISTSTEEATYDVTLEDLKDGTKYFYRINTLDSEDEEYDGSTLSFETLPRPKIENVRVQQVRGTAQTVVLVAWDTNTDTSSIVTYYPDGRPEEAKDEVNTKLQSGAHRVIVRDLEPQMSYALIVRGRDKAGNEASSEIQRFTTATDTRPPQILDANAEGTTVVKGSGGESQTEAQLVMTWNSDEASTSQVEYGEGTGTSYSQKTQEDTALVTNHTVVIAGLTPSKVYHLRIISKDKAGNVGNSVDVVSITPKATANALDLVVTSLRSVFGR